MFFVFAWDYYYPAGGPDDFIGAKDTFDAAIKLMNESPCDNGAVCDASMFVVARR